MSGNNNRKFTIVIAADHGGYDLKNILAPYIYNLGYDVSDLGVFTPESVDYPDMGAKAAMEILNGNAQLGVIICGTGIGISIAANRFPGIRAAVCHDEFTARMSRKHNNANMLALGARTTGTELAKAIVDVWFATDFEGGRHAGRVEKIDTCAIEAWKKYLTENN